MLNPPTNFSRRHWLRHVATAAVGLGVAACSLIEAHRDIYGRWRSEGISLAGISIPLAPSMEFSREAVTMDGKAQPVDGYRREGNRITVMMRGSAALTFDMEGSDAMTIDVPLLGKLRYTRVK